MWGLGLIDLLGKGEAVVYLLPLVGLAQHLEPSVAQTTPLGSVSALSAGWKAVGQVLPPRSFVIVASGWG